MTIATHVAIRITRHVSFQTAIAARFLLSVVRFFGREKRHLFTYSYSQSISAAKDDSFQLFEALNK